MADNKTASLYYDATSVAGPQSPTYIPPVEKFYWIRYTLPSGHPATKCILQHPFYFIHNYNMSEEIKRWAKVMLLDWKEITKEEYNIWLVISNKSAGEKETGADEVGVHTMD
jgi:hypothetical protein